MTPPPSRRVPQDVWEHLIGFVPHDRLMSSPTAACIKPLVSLHGGVLIRNLAVMCTEDKIGWRVFVEGVRRLVLETVCTRGIEKVLRMNRLSRLRAILPPRWEAVAADPETVANLPWSQPWPLRIRIRTVSSLSDVQFEEPDVFRLATYNELLV